MSIAPIVHEIDVAVPPAQAFDLFTRRFGAWWPVGMTPARHNHADVVIEPRAGGRWYEVDAQGRELQWGVVLAFTPPGPGPYPGRLLLGWQLNTDWRFDDTLLTEVEISFTPQPGGTRLRLEHRDLERFGRDADGHRGKLDHGWPSRMADFARFTQPVVVHGVPASPYVRAVIITAVEKDIPWRIEPIAPGAHKTPAWEALHPFGKMPAITHGDFRLYETQPILRYLDRLAPQPPLTPRETRSAARMDCAMAVNDCYLFNGVNNVIGFHRIVGPQFLGLTADEAAIEASLPAAHRVFAELSRLLGNDPFFAGGAVSLADCLIAPQMDMLARTPEWRALTAGRENLCAWLAAMQTRPSLAAAPMALPA